MTTTCTCGKPVEANTYLCRDCTEHVRNALTRAPSLMVDLELTMTRQRRFGDRQVVRGTGDDALPYNGAAAAALRDFRSELDAAVRMYRLTQHTTPPANSIAGTSAWLLARLPHMAGLPWAPSLLRIHSIADRGQRIIDAPVARIYAGPCGTCGTDLYAQPERAHVDCPDCGATYDLATRRAWLLDVVDDRLATATEISRALTSLSQPVTAARIRQWKHRNRLDQRGSDQVGRPLFRVGDVVDLLIEYAEKETTRRGA